MKNNINQGRNCKVWVNFFNNFSIKLIYSMVALYGRRLVRKMRYFIIISVILILGLSNFGVNAISSTIGESEHPSTRSTEPPEIDIEITSTDHRAHVAPNEDGVVTITGRISANVKWTPKVQSMVVNLTAQAGDWMVSDIPAMHFRHQDLVFTTTVQVPPLTHPEESRDLIIKGEWYYEPREEGNGTIETKEVHIEVMPFGHLEMDIDTENTTLYISESYTCKVTIKNLGTATARVDLHCNSDSREIEFILSDKYIEIPPNQSGEIEVEFKQSSGSPGTHIISITAEDRKYGPINRSFTLITKERSFIEKALPFIISGIVIICALSIFIGLSIFFWRKKGSSGS
jgi:hypothetical protein